MTAYRMDGGAGRRRSEGRASRHVPAPDTGEEAHARGFRRTPPQHVRGPDRSKWLRDWDESCLKGGMEG